MRTSAHLAACLGLSLALFASPAVFAQSGGASGNNAAGAGGMGSNNSNSSAPMPSNDMRPYRSDDGNRYSNGNYNSSNGSYMPDTGADPNSQNARQARPSGSGGENSGTAAPMSGPNR